jgi:hypothetical protein
MEVYGESKLLDPCFCGRLSAPCFDNLVITSRPSCVPPPCVVTVCRIRCSCVSAANVECGYHGLDPDVEISRDPLCSSFGSRSYAHHSTRGVRRRGPLSLCPISALLDSDQSERLSVVEPCHVRRRVRFSLLTLREVCNLVQIVRKRAGFRGMSHPAASSGCVSNSAVHAILPSHTTTLPRDDLTMLLPTLEIHDLYRQVVPHEDLTSASADRA